MIILTDGRNVRVSSGKLRVTMNGKSFRVEGSVMENMPHDLEVLIGMDVMERLGRVK